MFLIVIGVIIFIVWFYVLIGRAWMLSVWPQQVGWWQTIEDNLWLRSRTILSARLYWVGGAIIALHDMAAAAGIDVTPFTTELSNYIPEQWRGLALSGGFILTGLLFELMRRQTTVPIADIGDKN